MLEINEGDAVTIKQIESCDHRPRVRRGLGRPGAAGARKRSARSPSSAPARRGSPAAQQLRRAGHAVVVFERDEAAGGLVRFGVPDFKIEKGVVERRVAQLVAEGVELRLGVDVGVDIDAAEAARGVRRGRARDRLARAARPGGRGPRAPRHPLRDGVPLRAQPLGGRRIRPAAAGGAAAAQRDQRRRQGRRRDRRRRHRRRLRRPVDARGRALRGPARAGTGAAATAPRRAHAVAALAEQDAPLLRDEGGPGRRPRRARLLDRHDAGSPARAASRRSTSPQAQPRLRSLPVEGTEHELPADLVLLAMGFLHPDHGGVVEQLGVALDAPRQRRRAGATRPRSTACSSPATRGAASR